MTVAAAAIVTIATIITVVVVGNGGDSWPSFSTPSQSAIPLPHADMAAKVSELVAAVVDGPADVVAAGPGSVCFGCRCRPFLSNDHLTYRAQREPLLIQDIQSLPQNTDC